MNESQRPVTLSRVGGESLDLGRDAHMSLRLEADRYIVNDGRTQYPAPLLADLLPEEDVLTVKLGRVPPAPEGFVLVPAGPALAGDLLGVGAPDERPARLIDLPAFFLAERETTNAQFVRFLNAVGHCDESWIDLGGPKCLIQKSASGRYTTTGPDDPVVTVSLPGAMAYCSWLSTETGVPHRLPTEQEWEKAARGPASPTYAHGDISNPDAANQESGLLVATGQYPATGWGFHDLTGNAFEWTSSPYAPGLQVLRGGSYVLDGLYLRNSFRMWYRPLVQADDMGFRVLQEIQP